MKCICRECGKEFESKIKTSVCVECHTGVCVVCGAKFDRVYPYNQKTCSTKCRMAYVSKNAKPKPKACKWCGKIFEPKTTRQQYCGDDYGECPVCGKPVKILDYQIGATACSEKCRQARIQKTCEDKYGDACVLNSEHGITLRKQTCLDKYGVDHYSKTDEYKDTIHNIWADKPCDELAAIDAKRRATNQSNLGVDYPMQCDEVRAKSKAAWQSMSHDDVNNIVEKRSATCIEKYGVPAAAMADSVKVKTAETWASKSDDEVTRISDQRKQTCIDKYGVSHPMQSTDVNTKRKQTMLSKYGVENPMDAPEFVTKIAATMSDRYGVRNAAQLPEFREKAKQTSLSRYGAAFYNSSVYRALERKRNTTSEQADLWVKFRSDPSAFLLSLPEVPTYQDLCKMLGTDPTCLSEVLLRTGADTLVRKVRSTMEQDVAKLLDAYHLSYHHNYRRLIPPKEVDFYLPDHNLAIECNPTYTHNSSFGAFYDEPKSTSYHSNKSKLVADKGLFLFHIFGYEWTHKQEILSSMILNLCNCSNRKVFARNTEVREVPYHVACDFLNANHRQGECSSSIRLGLYYKGELMSLMTFGKVRRIMGDLSMEYELSRFCSKLNTSVVGGASKLLKHFISSYHPSSIVSYSDLAHTRGTMYSKLGFKQVGSVSSNYGWVSVTNDTYVSRIRSQKSNLPMMFDDVTEADCSRMTEKQIMENHGYAQVFECGTQKWVWTA